MRCYRIEADIDPKDLSLMAAALLGFTGNIWTGTADDPEVLGSILLDQLERFSRTSIRRSI